MRRQKGLLLRSILQGKLIRKFFFDPEDDEAGFFDQGGPRVAELQDQKRLEDSLHPRDDVKRYTFPHELVGNLA